MSDREPTTDPQAPSGAAPAHDALGAGGGASSEPPLDGTPRDVSPADGEVVTLDEVAAEVETPDEDLDPATAELRAELAAALGQRDEYLDDVRRARADFENLRKRTTREAGVAREHGRADVAAALLEVLDDLDRTREAAVGSPDEALAKGVDLVADKLRRALEGQGLVRVDATGEPFDPEVHEAVQQVEADEPTDQPVVHQVLRAGYRLGERTLRPAMVVVAG